MKTIIAGSRDVTDYDIVLRAIDSSGFQITAVVSGGARGVDSLGERYASENHLKLHIYLAQWKRLGKRAGYIRNQQMADAAEALIAVWDGQSRGTKHMIDIATDKGLKVFVYEVR